MLRLLFDSLSKGATPHMLEKHEFLQLFPVAGLIGERLFSLFAGKHAARIDFEEFLGGIARACRGTEEEHFDFLFELYDISGCGSISKDDIVTILHNLLPNHAR